MNAPDLVIFDCDGVLVDSEIIACRTDADYLTEIGFPTSIEEIITRYIGTSAQTMKADLERRFAHALPDDFSDRLRDRIIQAFEKELQAMDGIAALLDALPCRTCVASSSITERIERALTLTGLRAHFGAHIFSTTQVAHGKPAPDLFLFAAAQMETAPDDCLVIEDSLAGVQAAVAAGMPVIGFTGGSHCRPGHAEALRAAGAFATADRMDRMLALMRL